MLRLNDYWMQPTDVLFKDMAKYTLGAEHTRRIFIDRGSKILFVAHLDTVQLPRIDGIKETKNYRALMHGAGFDDRLGCKIAHELSIEYQCDLLLTDLEEQGDSTAQWHDCKNYNWICEFDRAGDDVVTYGMESDRWLAVLGKYWTVGQGMFSDISFMKTDCCAMNLGIGYEHAHGENSYYDVDTAHRQVALFRQFFNKQCRNKYVADEGRRDSIITSFGFGDAYGNYYDNAGCCCICGNYAEETIYELHLCEECVDRMVDSEIII